MSWRDIKDNTPKPTDKQIKCAEALIKERYGDIDCGLDTMSSAQVSELIDDLLYKPPEKVKIKHSYTPRPEPVRKAINHGMLDRLYGDVPLNSASAINALHQAQNTQMHIDSLHRDISEEETERVSEIFRTMFAESYNQEAIAGTINQPIITAESLQRTLDSIQRTLHPVNNPETRGDNNE